MKNIKRILALICVIILVGLYILTFIMSFVDKTASLSLFKGCVATTIFLPVAIYAYMCLHKYAMTRSGRKNYYEPKENLKDAADPINDSVVKDNSDI